MIEKEKGSQGAWESVRKMSFLLADPVCPHITDLNEKVKPNPLHHLVSVAF